MNRDITHIVEAWLHEPAPLSDRGIARVAHVVHQTPQRRGWLPRIATRRYRSMFNPIGIVFGSATVALAAVVGLSGVLVQPPSTGPAPAAAVSASASPSPDATSAVVPAEVTRHPGDPRIAGDGPWLEWEPMVAPEPGEAAGGPGSRETETGWRAEDRGYRVEVADYQMTKRGKPGFPVGYRPVEVEVARPDGSVSTSRIDGPWKTQGVAIGPRGLVLQLGDGIDRWDIYRLATGRRLPQLCCSLDRDGVVHTKPGEGLPREIRPSQYRERLRAVGLTPADLRAHRRDDMATTWFSRDGEAWTQIEGWPYKGHPSLVATVEGFFAMAQEGIAYTADGTRWALLPASAGVRGWYRWGDGILAALPGRLARVTPTGLVDLPFSDEVLGPDGAIASLGDELGLDWHAGEDGVVLGYSGSVAADDFGVAATIGGVDPSGRMVRVILYSPDGERWSLSRAPEAWDEDGRYTALQALDGEIIVTSRGFDNEPADFFRGIPRTSTDP